MLDVTARSRWTPDAVGPNPVSTAFVIIFGIGVVTTVAGFVRDMGTAPEDRYYRARTAVYATGVVAYAAGYVLYYVYYRRRRPWFGWLLFMTGAVFMSVLLASDENGRRKCTAASARSVHRR